MIYPISFPVPALSLLVGAQSFLTQSRLRNREIEGIELITEIIGARPVNVSWYS